MTGAYRPIVVDLFAGAGGLSLGFEQAGFDIAAAIDIDPIHCAVHEFNFPNCKSICSSVTELSGADIRKFSGIGKKEIDVVIGGAPCQGFSMIGKRALDDPRNRLVHHFVRIVKELKPRYFVFENVKGLTVGAHRRFLDEIVSAFSKIGYSTLLPWRVLNAAEYGVPQDRRRLFLLGARKNVCLPAYPETQTRRAGSPITSKITERLKPEGPTVWDALSDLPDADSYQVLLHQDSVTAKFGPPSLYGKVARGIACDAHDFSHPRLFDQKLLTSSLRTVHSSVSRNRFAATPHGQTEPVSRFLKLDPDGVCNTLRAGTGSDLGAFTSPRPIHPFYPRCITVREAARLHSYPDWFRFHATKWHGFRQIGNSVPPFLARVVAEKIIAALRIH
ncbi:MAG: DNA cytosine methyltransferase, partial [Rhodospirillales bacterium]|nr:DNA cytosine methyltransferase [Rhodospirillales bacterium]